MIFNYSSLKKLVMKKLLPILMIAAITTIIFAASNSKPQPDTSNGKVLTYVDTMGLADFQKWKAQNELKDPSMYKQDNEFTEPVMKTPVQRTSVSRTTKKVSMSSTDRYPAKVVQKKGWSRKAKGAAIGGAGGAIFGAVINKNNRVKGGIVGGLLGAGLGYVIGNEMDRKHGR
jgi:hypothetical protein